MSQPVEYSWTVVPETTPPTLVYAVARDARTLDITFSEPVIASEALNKANYAITGGAGLTVESVEQLTADSFRLKTTKQVVGQSYLVTASNIHDLNGNLI